MILNKIELGESKRFSSILLDYLENKEELKSHFEYPPSIESFEQAISNRNYDDRKREILVNVLKRQYKNITNAGPVIQNIDLLNQQNTYTITTGHQLNIFTGPLYFIYKIVSAINMAKILNEKYSANNFIPVYWMASEDHDFEEINNFKLFGNKITWESEQKGPVGKFDTNSIKEILDEINEMPYFFKKAYLECKNLSDATRHFVNHLFGKYGLVVLDADDKELKSELKPIIKDDLFSSNAHKFVQSCTGNLEKLGYKSQIYPRPINFFYMADGVRERIENIEGTFHVLNTSISFSKQELETLIEEHPERFSPNVVLRPVYQEVILPNLAYIGGPAEVAYWLQLKDVFDHYSIPFPVLFPRLFVMLISKAIYKKMNKLGLEIGEVFKDFATLKDVLLFKDTEPKYDLSVQLDEIKNAFESIKLKVQELDKSLEGFAMSEFKKTEKGGINIQKRLKNAEEQKQSVTINQLKGILDKLFPNGNPQEREDNFLNFYINNPGLIDELINQLNPFELKYNILTEDAQA